MTAKKIWRCAIYTRKSSDEGLEQDFNSLYAQREACSAYIRSQSQEGWRVLPQLYDDGGWSGGTLDRPALKLLLTAVEAREVDIIVLYKIDRLTRSLTDFAKLAELFDAKGVSFVSVTQQFNTTTSMGRLMLNVLLSFAQFEREVTGERIRDKIAASKKKGLWMGGTVPLGYDAIDRSLVINQEEAETVRFIFKRYLDLGSVSALEADLQDKGIRTKTRAQDNGRITGNRPYSRGHLYRLLSSPIYRGHVPHKDKSYPGLHEAIIDRITWDKVQALLAVNTQGPRKRRARVKEGGPLLVGILIDENGVPLIPNHANKKGRRYRYYVEKIPSANSSRRRKRIPALEIEAVIKTAVHDFLKTPARLMDTLDITGAEDTARVLAEADKLVEVLADADTTVRTGVLRPLLNQVICGKDNLIIRFDRTTFLARLGLPHLHPTTDSGFKTTNPEITLPLSIRTRGVEMKLIIPGATSAPAPRSPDPALIKAVARGYRWFQLLKTGAAPSVGAIAKAEGITSSFITRTMRLAFLSPTLIEQILNGTQPPDLTADWLMESGNVPVRWSEQRKKFEA